MNCVRRIAKNIFVLSSSEITVKVLQVFLLIFIARILREVEFGKYTFTIAFSTIAIIFADIGMQTLLIREMSRNRKIVNKYIVNASILKLFLSIIAFCIVVVSLNILNYSVGIRLIVYIFYLSFILKSFIELFSSVFLASEKMEWAAFIKISRAFILTSLVVLALLKGMDLIAVASIYLMTEVILLILALVILFKKFIRLKFEFDFSFIKKLLKQSIPFALTAVFYNIYYYIDSVMLSKIKGNYEVGIYGAAYSIPVALILIPAIYTSAIFPVISRFYITSKESLIYAYERSLKYIATIAFPVSMILFLSSYNIMHFLYGPGYHVSGFILKILAIVIVFRFISYLNGVVLASVNRQKERVIFQGITACINIILNLILIPSFSFVGAAIATIISEFILLIFYMTLIFRYVTNMKSLLIILKPFIATIIISPILFIDISAFITIPSAIILYSAFILIFKVFDKEDIRLLKKILNKNRS